MEESSLLKLEFLSDILFFLSNHPSLIILIVILLILVTLRLLKKNNPVYLIDFQCYRAPDSLRVPITGFVEHLHIHENFDEDSGTFQQKVLEKSGLGNDTYLPPGLHEIPLNISLANTISEIETIMFSTGKDLFSKHDIDPKSIDILVCNCSLAVPIPSISSMVVNRFGLRSDIKSFNLSGQGCSAGILSLNLAKNLLKVHPNSIALLFSMESVSSNIYAGKVKSMLLPNCLFRMGGAHILLSNRKQDKCKAKYELQHLITTHIGHKDMSSYNCVTLEEDREGQVGVSLSRAVPQVAGEALKSNMVILSPLVLPFSELFLFGLSVVLNKLSPRKGKAKARIPNFKNVFDHFCIHAGSKAMVEGIGTRLGLGETDIEPSKMTLHKFGNTSSSSTWYSFSYLEAKGIMRNGDTIWQLALGSGFKCNSAVWKCIAKSKMDTNKNVWSDFIHLYPAKV